MNKVSKVFVFELQQALINAGFSDVVLKTFIPGEKPTVTFELYEVNKPTRWVVLELLNERNVNIINGGADFGNMHTFKSIHDLATQLFLKDPLATYEMPDFRKFTGLAMIPGGRFA